MAWDWIRTEGVLNSLGGLAVLALGLVLLRSKPHTTASRSLGAFASAFGAATAIQNILLALGLQPTRDNIPGAIIVVAAAVFIASTPALLVFTRAFPKPAKGLRSPTFWLPFATFLLPLIDMGVFYAASDHDLWTSFVVSWFSFTWWAFGTSIALFALRYNDPALNAGDRRLVAIVAAVIAIYWTFQAGAGITTWPFVTGFPIGTKTMGIVRSGSVLVVAGLWLISLVRARSGEGRGARNVLLVILATLLYAALRSSLHLQPFGESGIARLVMAGVLGYEVLVNRFLGLDARVRWGVSRGAIGATMLAAFFVASEAAQQFIGDRVENVYIGIGAAALLVLGLSPLQRFADRLAAKAVPQPSPDRGTREEREHRFRTVATRFLADGRVTKEEERTLAHLAEDLGIPGGRAFDIRSEVLAQAASGRLG
jgi:hypothetical protein